ncbi:LOW QUALITY PROTEIN: AIG1-type guanine nucleotide-binding (G) domain containing protein [Trema orientale]|uniref:AIG1-type guanine nucleotide-binding (G) domain containing protein n=1 Tax=Trema orientale TaxID=63057 RepID=A0A2P5E7A6_TREOI|nr:LOW QUALITY PROTEIN: AIG1-type guanine nucleotide-binding (G) domain containing protein [Trema orientale]
MGGSGISEDGWEVTCPSNEDRTVVLVGRTGNGKSATANSIIGRKIFKSKARSSGLFDLSAESEYAGKEIVKCVSMAKDGSMQYFFSVRGRFSHEEKAALCSFEALFGKEIVNYMIVVFTGGDELEENEETLEDYLGRECPEPLKDILTQCDNRVVLFDNKTKDESKRVNQVQKLLSLVNKVLEQNGGHPYTDKIFAEVKVITFFSLFLFEIICLRVKKTVAQKTCSLYHDFAPPTLSLSLSLSYAFK